MKSAPLLTVVLPAYEEEGVLGGTLGRIRDVVAGHGELLGRVEYVVVSDGSRDGTFDEALAELEPGCEATVVQLARNVGSHAALRCGLRYAHGDFVAMMACDGQDPPELLPEMLDRFGAGVDIVWGQRRSRRQDSAFDRLASRAFYALARWLTSLDFPPAGLDFVMVRRRVVDVVLDRRERNVSLFLMLFNLGFGQDFVEYDRGKRAGGTSGWTLRKKLALAVDMLTSFSAAPLRLVSLAGTLVGLFGLVFGGSTMVRALLGQVPVQGWASLMVFTSVIGGIMLLALGILGEYVWRILDEVRDRPPYLEDRRATRRASEDGGDASWDS